MREHGSQGLISSTTAGTGCLGGDLAVPCGCHSTDTPESALGWGEDSTGCCCGTGPLSKNTSLTSSLGSWGGCFKRCQAGRKSSRCFFHAWKKTGKLFGEWWVMAKAAKENGMCEGKTEPREEYQSQGPQLLFGQSAGWLSLTVLSCFKQVFFCWCFYSWSSSQTLQQRNWSVKAPNQWLWPAKGTGRVLPAVPVSSASPKLHPQSAAY